MTRLANGMKWHTGDVVRTVAVAAAVIFGLIGLWYASAILLFTFLGVLLGLPLTAGVDRLARWHIPRALGALLLVVVGLGALAGIGAAVAPTLTDQAREIRARLPEAATKIKSVIDSRVRSIGAITGQTSQQHPDSTKGTNTVVQAQPQPQGRLAQIARGALGVIGSTVELLIYLLLVLFVAVYMAVDPEVYHTGFLHLIPHGHRERIAEVLAGMAGVMRRWLLTQCVAMVTIGVLWGVALSLLRVKAALALAVIAGLLEFVPTIGPTIAAVPAIGIGVLDSPQKGLSVLLVYLAVQGIESNILIPVLMKGQIDLPPALTIVWQALMALAFGFLGLLVAVPLLAAVLVAIKMLYVRDVVGDPVPLGRAADPGKGGLAT
jgi:predicted PurR-regulated permease PerM